MQKFFREDINRSHYTLGCMITGLVGAACLYLFIPAFTLSAAHILAGAGPHPDQCGWWLGCVFQLVFILITLNEVPLVFQGAVIMTAAGLPSLLCLFGSAQLDFFRDEDKEEAESPMRGGVYFYGAAWIGIALWALVWDGATETAGVAILAIPIFFLNLVVSAVVIPITVALTIGGLLCLPRAIIYWITTSRLRRPYEDGVVRRQFDAPAVAASLGAQVQSDAHARALRKDLGKLHKDIAPRLKRTRAENARLSKSIKQDTARMELETELSQNMAELEDLEIENEAMRAAIRRQSRD